MSMVELSTLVANPRNPRKIAPAAFAKLCRSIQRDKRFMELRPIVVDDDRVIIGGNQRYRALYIDWPHAFKRNRLIRDDSVPIPDEPDEFGMQLRRRAAVV